MSKLYRMTFTRHLVQTKIVPADDEQDAREQAFDQDWGSGGWDYSEDELEVTELHDD